MEQLNPLLAAPAIAKGGRSRRLPTAPYRIEKGTTFNNLEAIVVLLLLEDASRAPTAT